MATMIDVLASLGEPDLRYVVSVSGGKDSAALALYINQEYPQIPVEYVFCDTNCELQETYDYLNRMEALLGCEVQRINALTYLQNVPEKNRNAFDYMLKEVYSGFLPSPRSRWCTRALKIQPFERFIGDSTCFSFIGIRADENREGYQGKKPPVLSQRPNITPVYPFKDDGLGLADIQRLLDESGLGMPEYYKWRSRSGCYFCFYQQVGEWQRLREEHPDLFEKAQSYETDDEGAQFTWVDGRPLADLPAGDIGQLPEIDSTHGCAICHL